ncbi:MAG: hypothetical protein KAH30_06950 [Caldisericia bacterium]|nr:hypothetical protein [Caldisericia bacterium]
MPLEYVTLLSWISRIKNLGLWPVVEGLLGQDYLLVRVMEVTNAVNQKKLALKAKKGG